MPLFVSKSAWHSDVNALGSNIVLTDDDQNVIVRYEYDVFGAIRSEVGSSDNPRKFTGKEYESDVKLYYFAARYYDPYIGRFTQRDPIGDGLNWYAYARNNPLAFIDPTGTTIVIVGPGGANNQTIAEVVIDKTGVTYAPGLGKHTVSLEASLLSAAIQGEQLGTTTDHPALADVGAVGVMVRNVINSDKLVFVHFDPSLQKPGETDFTSANSDEHISIRIDASYAKPNDYARFLRTRIAVAHELVHAHQAIEDPAKFRDRSYYNVFGLEYGAYDAVARMAAELGGVYTKALGYVPEYFLHPSRFNPNSFGYHGLISMKARQSAAPFR